MRDYTTLTIIMGANQVTLDGEAYMCEPLPFIDIQGSVRKVPGDRVLAIQWHGEHGHGSVEGYGAMEGFTDKAQLAPFVKAWLKARAKAKAADLDLVKRRRQQGDEAIAANAATVESVNGDLANLTAEAATAKGDALAVVNQRIEMTRRNLAWLADATANIRANAVTDGQIADAQRTADAAQKESDNA